MKKKNVLALVTVMAMSIAAGCGAQQTQPEDSESIAVTEQAPSDSEVQSTEESASDSEESEANESAPETDTQEEETTQEVKAEKEDGKVNETGDVKEDMAEDVKEDEIPSHAMEQGWKFYPKDTVFSVDFATLVHDWDTDTRADMFENAEAVQTQAEIHINNYGKRKPDENGIVTYILDISMDGEVTWKVKDGHVDKYGASCYFPHCCILDYYTGLKLPSKNSHGDDEISASADIEIDGKTYTVSYTDSIKWDNGDYDDIKGLYSPNGWWTEKYPANLHHNITIYAPQEYDGLVIGIGPRTEMDSNPKDVDYQSYDELMILGQKEDGTFANLDDWYFFRLSEFKLH